MIKKIEIHVCDLCGKENNNGDQYESGKSKMHLKGSIGSSYSSGGYSFDNNYDLCLHCTKKLQKWISEQESQNKH